MDPPAGLPAARWPTTLKCPHNCRQDVRYSSLEPPAWLAAFRLSRQRCACQHPASYQKPFQLPCSFPHVACPRVGQAGSTWQWVVLPATTQWTESRERFSLKPKEQKALVRNQPSCWVSLALGSCPSPSAWPWQPLGAAHHVLVSHLCAAPCHGACLADTLFQGSTLG